MRNRKIPDTDSVKELAEFWDEHDLTDYEGELQEVTERVFSREGSASVTLDLKPDEAAEVKRIAKARRIGYKPLIRRWILEGLRNEKAGKTASAKARQDA